MLFKLLLHVLHFLHDKGCPKRNIHAFSSHELCSAPKIETNPFLLDSHQKMCTLLAYFSILQQLQKAEGGSF